MNPRYYPHLTAALAAAVTVAPLLLVLAISRMLNDASTAELHAPPAAVAATLRETNVRTKGAAGDLFDVPMAPLMPADSSLTNPPETRIAMRTPHLQSVPPAQPAANQPTHTPTNLMPHSTHGKSQNKATAGTPEPVSRLSDSAIAMAELSTAVGPGEIPPPDSAAIAAEETKPSRAQEARPATEEAGPAADDSNIAVSVAVADTSAFDATGHLALAGVAAPRHAMAHPQNETDEASGMPVAAPADHSQRKSARKRTALSEARPAISPAPAIASASVDAEFGQTLEADQEDVIIQQPLESRRVSRMENLIGVTKARGWPIALVRSDLPDDYWWVQQMVGLRGNTFAARVNFGNENSISGSVYHLVIVFLDTQEEVRRFRIAKQFKELPEGVRRSREFTFVRR